MPDLNLRHLWKETLSSKPASRETFKGMHLSVLHQATQQKLDEHLLHILFETGDFILCELKGRPKQLTGFELPAKSGSIRWLCLQFHGTLSFSDGYRSKPDTIFSFVPNNKDDHLLTVPAEKQWILLLGVTGESQQLLLSECPLLRTLPEQQEKGVPVAVPISYTERKLLQEFSRIAFGPLTTLHQIALLLARLFGSYAERADKKMLATAKEDTSIVLYHQAIGYITAHYMDEYLSTDKIADACHCSPRTLTRAFEGRPHSVKSSILLIRLQKSRELLLRKPDLSIEQIAGMLHFYDAKHFRAQYKKCFHRTPREERKALSVKTGILKK